MKTIAFLAAMTVAGSLPAQQATSPSAAPARGATSAQKAATAKPALAPVAVDSPLVQAARRTGAKKSTMKVITNETLKEMNKGRITTSKVVPELVAAPDQTEANTEKAFQDDLQKQREVAAAKTKEAEAKKAAEMKRIDRLRRSAAAAEDGDAWLDGDPAALEELQRTGAEAAGAAKP